MFDSFFSKKGDAEILTGESLSKRHYAGNFQVLKLISNGPLVLKLFPFIRGQLETFHKYLFFNFTPSRNIDADLDYHIDIRNT